VVDLERSQLAFTARPDALWLRIALSASILAAACGAAIAVALLNVLYFRSLQDVLELSEPLAQALLFSSFLFLLGGAVVVRRPRTFGFRAGETRRHVRLVVATVVGLMAFTAVALALVGATPYSDASWFVEIVLVPLPRSWSSGPSS
jgi:TRAP-type C4-dicarboxylate transport system permease small subunit